MNGFELLKAMEHIDEGLIEETYRHKRASRSAKWRVTVSFAASVACVLLILAILLLPEQLGFRSQKSGSGIGANIFDRENGTIPMDAIREIDTILREKSEEGMTDKMEEACNEVLKKYRVPLLYPTSEEVGGKYLVIDDDGSISYDYEHYVAYDNDKKTWVCQPTLTHRLSKEAYFLGGDTDEWNLEKFLEKSRENGAGLEEKMMYAEELLEDEQYFLLYTETSHTIEFPDGYPEVFVIIAPNVSETQREALREHNIYCGEHGMPVEELNEYIRNLWEQRDELGILDINPKRYSDSNVLLDVTINIDETTILEKLTDDEEAYVKLKKYGVLKTDVDYACAKGLENLDDFMAFIKDCDSHWINPKDKETLQAYEEYTEKLKIALQRLKTEYPEYSYLQLYYHVAYDLDYECYLNFDKELNLFVNSLGICKEEKFFIDELDYGDSEMIELKRMLKQYKQLYPDLSYEKLYEKCGYQDFLENDPTADNYERLMWSLYQKHQFSAKMEKAERNKDIAAIIACLGFFVIVVLVEWKKRSGMKREVLALAGNMLLYVVLPECLTGAPDALGAVMLPNYYLTPVFILAAMLWYRFKGGKYWRFMIYTGGCIFVEAFAVIDSSPLYTLLLPAVVCEVVILVCGNRLIAKIKNFLDIVD